MKPLEQEIWRDIDGFPGYQVSNLGRIRSCLKKQGEWRIMSPCITNDGYERVSLRTGIRKSKSLSVHRLVAKTFVPGYREGLQVNHKDENTQNNRADNLEWVTQYENNHYGTATERRMRTAVRRMVLQMTMDGKVIARYYGPCDASRNTGVGRRGIYAACNGEQKQAGGYRWQWDEKRDGDAPAKKAKKKNGCEWQPMDGEQWRNVSGYEGLYAVSDLGRVRSLRMTVNGGLMRPADVNGCQTILLVKDGKKRGFTIASLVARAFVDGYKPDLWVCHKNGNQKDNRAINLEWTERTDRRIARGLSKPLYKMTIDGETVAEYQSVTDAASELGIKNGKRIVSCCNGQRDTAYGYRWQWKSQNN